MALVISSLSQLVFQGEKIWGLQDLRRTVLARYNSSGGLSTASMVIFVCFDDFLWCCSPGFYGCSDDFDFVGLIKIFKDRFSCNYFVSRLLDTYAASPSFGSAKLLLVTWCRGAHVR